MTNCKQWSTQQFGKHYLGLHTTMTLIIPSDKEVTRLLCCESWNPENAFIVITERSNPHKQPKIGAKNQLV